MNTEIKKFDPDKLGSPCPEFWDWLPRAYRDGNVGTEAKFTKYNMEVAFHAGKQSAALQTHWCTYCGGINAHNCQFNTTIPRTQIYTTNHTGVGDGKTS